MIDDLIRKEELTVMRNAIEGLDGIYRKAIDLFLEGKTDREIGEKLGISRSRTHEIKKMAIAILKEKATNFRH